MCRAALAQWRLHRGATPSQDRCFHADLETLLRALIYHEANVVVRHELNLTPVRSNRRARVQAREVAAIEWSCLSVRWGRWFQHLVL